MKTKEVEKPNASEAKQSYAERKEQQKKITKAEKNVKESEKKIEELEKQLNALNERLCQPENASNMKLIEEYSQIQRQLDDENDRWMRLSEELEKLQ